MKKSNIASSYRSIALLLVLCVFTSTACFAQNKVDSIPFHYDAKLIVFKGKINDIDTDFAFDTGASMSVLPTDIAASAKVNVGRSRFSCSITAMLSRSRSVLTVWSAARSISGLLANSRCGLLL